MDLKRERRLYRLLQDLVAEPAEQRLDLVARMTDLGEGDRSRLLDLVKHVDEAVTRSDQEDRDAATLGSVSEVVGNRIGPYTLVEELGQGGCGVVFKAWQESPVCRGVALKIVKPGMDTREVIARFAQEQQALALMDHPGIARVFDAGTAPSGRPFFAMELVHGEPITDHCDRNRLTTDERLQLFAEVCRAVDHAHRKGLVHRDLKPGNVLVAGVDGAGRPKIIDFGIAKATVGRLTDVSIHTGMERVIGTLKYMSPEQATPDGREVDARSDIYSLGILLYELLVGETPITDAQLEQVGAMAQYQLPRELSVQRPSSRLASLGVRGSVRAARRGVEARTLALMLRGDLDWVVLKCLEQDRDRRYASAAELAADIERYLAGEAVRAAPPSWLYRTRKGLVRHRGVVLNVTITLVALASLIVAWQASARGGPGGNANTALEGTGAMHGDLADPTPLPTPDELATAATLLHLELVGLTAEYEEVIENDWIDHVAGSVHLRRAEVASARLISDGRHDDAAVHGFHHGLAFFIRALTDFPTWTAGTTGARGLDGPRPSKSGLESLAAALRHMQQKANAVPGLEATERIVLRASSSPEEIASYGRRVLDAVRGQLYEKPLERVTGEGVSRTNEVMAKPLAALEGVLGALGEPDTWRSRESMAAALGAVEEQVASLRLAGELLSQDHTYAGERVDRLEPVLLALLNNIQRLRSRVPSGEAPPDGSG